MVTSEIGVVQRIYRLYLDGASLGGIADIDIKNLICQELELAEFDEQAARSRISQISISCNNQIDIIRSSKMNLQF